MEIAIDLCSYRDFEAEVVALARWRRRVRQCRRAAYRGQEPIRIAIDTLA